MLLLVTFAMVPWLLTTIYHAIEQRQSVIGKEQENALRFARIVSFDQRETIAHARALLQALSTMPEIQNGPQVALFP